MFQDVAVPYVAAGKAFERDDDACDHSRIGAYRILPAALARGRRNRGSRKADGPLVLELKTV